MKRKLIVSVDARLGIMRVLNSQTGDPDRRLQVAELYSIFSFSPEEEEEVSMRDLSYTEKIAQGYHPRDDPKEWDHAAAATVTWEKELIPSQWQLLKSVMKAYDRYVRADEWLVYILDQLDTPVPKEDKKKKSTAAESSADAEPVATPA